MAYFNFSVFFLFPYRVLVTIPRDVARTEVLANLDLQTKVIVACALLVLCSCTASKVRDRIFQNFFNFS